MQKNNHICKICGAEYYACDGCDTRKTWRSFCDLPEHYQVYQILLMYSRKMISADEATETLEANGILPDTAHGFTSEKIEQIREIFNQSK